MHIKSLIYCLYTSKQIQTDAAHVKTFTLTHLNPASHLLSADTETKADCCILLIHQLNIQITSFTAA